MHVLSIVLLITMALAKGMALRGIGATFTARLTSRLSAGAIPSMARQYGSSKKAYPSSSSRMRDRSERRPIPQPKATILKATAPTEPQLVQAPVPPLKESRPSPEKSRKGPEILETFPDALLPKNFASWSGTETDFKRLIILEDDAILVVFKPAGVMAQPDDDEKAAGVSDAGFGTSSKPSESSSRVVVRNNRYFYPDIDILTLAKKYLEREAEKAAANQPKPKQRSKYLDEFDDDDEYSRKQKSVFVGLVHRLDRPASGLMILAKTPEALKNLNKQFADQVVIKRYVCMVNGKIDKPDVCIDYLLKTSGDVAKVVRNPFRIKSGGSSNSTSTSTSSSSSSSGSTTESDTILSIDDILEGRVDKGTSANTNVPTEGTTATSNDPRLRSDVVRAELSYTPLHVIEHTVRKKWDNIAEAKNARPRFPKRPTSSSSSSSSSPAANVAPETEEVVKVMADGYVETKTYQTLLNVTLLTGRKHQIRTQLSHRQHPIVGDQKYLAPQAFGERDISLHAYYLGFFHPTTRARVALRLDVPRIWEKRFGRDTWKQIVPLVAKPVHTKLSKASTDAVETATTTAVDAVGADPSTATAETATATATPVAPAASTTVA